MTKLDWSKQRTRAQMLRAAADRLPNPVRAAYDGTCGICSRVFHRGDRIARDNAGWAHHHCTLNL